MMNAYHFSDQRQAKTHAIGSMAWILEGSCTREVGRWQAHTKWLVVWLEVHPSPFLLKNHDSVICGQIHVSFEDRSFKLSETRVIFLCRMILIYIYIYISSFFCLSLNFLNNKWSELLQFQGPENNHESVIFWQGSIHLQPHGLWLYSRSAGHFIH